MSSKAKSASWDSPFKKSRNCLNHGCLFVVVQIFTNPDRDPGSPKTMDLSIRNTAVRSPESGSYSLYAWLILQARLCTSWVRTGEQLWKSLRVTSASCFRPQLWTLPLRQAFRPPHFCNNFKNAYGTLGKTWYFFLLNLLRNKHFVYIFSVFHPVWLERSQFTSNKRAGSISGSGSESLDPWSHILDPDPSWELQSMVCFCRVSLTGTVLEFLEKISVNFTASVWKRVSFCIRVAKKVAHPTGFRTCLKYTTGNPVQLFSRNILDANIG